jgi:hypothetical protein
MKSTAVPAGEKYLWPKLFELFHDKRVSLPAVEQGCDRRAFRLVFDAEKTLSDFSRSPTSSFRPLQAAQDLEQI